MNIYDDILEKIDDIEQDLNLNNIIAKSKRIKIEQLKNLQLKLSLLQDEFAVLEQEINYEK